MKTVLCFILLCISYSGFSQTDWKKLCDEKPKTALAKAEKMYDQALLEKNGPKLIQALTIRIYCQSLIDSESILPLFQEIEKLITNLKNPVEKSILHSILAEYYQDYYNQHAYQINQRTPLANFVPEDIKEWSGNLFIEKIFYHALAALEAQTDLEKTPASTYNLILKTGSDSKQLRPTLYDFLAYRSIEQLRNCNSENIARFFPQSTPSHPDFLSVISHFISIPLETKPYDVVSNVFKIYQNLLKFRVSAANRPALLLADLDRLTYGQEILQNDSLYLRRLQELERDFSDIPYVVEILYEEARLYWSNSSRSDSALSEIKKALYYCELGLKKYPDYERIGLLKDLKNEIENPELHVSLSEIIYPNTSFSLKANYKNITQIKLSISRLQETTRSYEQKKNNKTPLQTTSLYTKSYTLPSEPLQQDTSFSLPALKSGMYELLIEANGKKTDNMMFIVNDLFTAIQIEKNNRVHFMVRNKQSGKPIPNATINVYEALEKQYPPLAHLLPLTQVKTDKNGRATLKLTSGNKKYKQFYYEVTDIQNPNNYIYSYYYDASFFERSNAQIQNVNFFTDRKIYRPGQTVLFSGIAWASSPDSSILNTEKTYTIQFYHLTNSQNRKELTVKTNEWGSFSGSFVIPKEGLNGTYILSTTNGQTQIEVAEYKRPEIEIQIDPLKKPYAFGDTLQIDGHLKTYSGVPLDHSKINYQIYLKQTYRWQTPEPSSIKGQLSTDIDGNFQLKFPTKVPATHNPVLLQGYYYEIILSATDSKGETQETAVQLPMNVSPFSLEIRFPEYVNKEMPIAFSVLARNSSDYKVSENISYTFYKLAPLNSLEQTYHPDSIKTEKKMAEGVLLTNTDSSLNLKTWDSGAYVILVRGGNIEHKKIFYLYSPQDKRPPIQTYNWLIQEKTSCKPGENAEILFGSSAKNVYVLYELYDGYQLLKREFLQLSDQVKHFSIPYSEQYGNTLCLMLSFVKEGKFFNNQIEIHKIQANKDLIIQTKVFRDQLQPGQKENWEFIIRDHQGLPVTAEILAVLYDQSLDQFLKNNWYFNPFPGWNSNYPLWRTPMYPPTPSIYMSFPIPYKAVPPFQFDELKLYKQPYAYYEARSLHSLEDRNAGMPIANHKAALPVYAQDTERSETTNSAPGKKLTLRENFQETVFFYPQLVSNDSGIVRIHFTMPDATTRWKFMALAHTRSLSHGLIEKEITTSKQLMVMPNLPRYFRNGDSTILKTTVSNRSGNLQTGQVTLELFDPLTKRVQLRRVTDFTANPQQNTTVSQGFTVPQNISVIGCRIIASTSDFSDGEQHLIAVVPDKVMLTEALPFFINQKGIQTFHLDAVSPTKEDYRLTLEVTTNPLWYAVLALPSLQQPQTENISSIAAAFYVNTIGNYIATANPRIVAAIQTLQAEQGNATDYISQLEKNPELKSILLENSPWVLDAQNETERIQSLAQLFDQNRLQQLQQTAFQKIQALQEADGGWSWFKGMPSDRFMTCNVLNIFSMATLTGKTEGGEKEKMMQIKALRYLDNEILKDYEKKNKKLTYSQILYLYVRSFYRDIPLGEALQAHKYYIGLAEKEWNRFSLYEKALTATTLFRYGKPETARKILNSLQEYATVNAELGMFWANNNSSGYSLNSAIQVHTAIMEAFHEIEGNTAHTDLMKQWLLRQKQTQNWGNTPSTVDAIYALLLTGNTQLDSQEQLTVALGNQKIDMNKADQMLGYIKTVYPATAISPDLSQLTITKEQNTPSWGALYLQYFDQLKQVQKKKKDILNIEKKLFIEKNSESGPQLIPLNTSLQIGDKIVVRLTVSLDRDMEYIHLKDSRAACFEPVQQISGNQWKYGTFYYEEIKDGVSNFFIRHLPKGTYVFEYPVWVNQEGIYQDGLATIQSMYAPEFVSHSRSQEIEVR